MAGIKQPLLDIMMKLREITVSNGEGQTQPIYVRIWNNQLDDEKDGKLYDFPKPAALVEAITPVEYEAIGLGFRSSDLGIRIHLIHEYYNQDGTFEQDLEVFDLRDQIIAKLHLFEPTACAAMIANSEEQDFSHTNLYHYIIDLVCDFTDSKGSKYDPDRGEIIDKDPPTSLEFTVDVDTSIDGHANQFATHEYKISTQ